MEQNTEKHLEQTKIRRCTYCGTPLPTGYEFKRCEKCREYFREVNRRHLKKLKKQNVCKNCGDGVIYKGSLCKRCYDVQMNYYKRSVGLEREFKMNEKTSQEKEELKNRLCEVINQYEFIPTLKKLEERKITSHKECYNYGGYKALIQELQEEGRIKRKSKKITY